MNTKKKNWAGLIGFIILAGALLYPFVSIGDNATPFDHFLKAGYGYENPELDYGEYGKPVTLQALPFDGATEDGSTTENVISTDNVNSFGDVSSFEGGTPITETVTEESSIGSATIEVSDPVEVSEPIVTPDLPAQTLTQPPTDQSILVPFQNHLPQDYIGNGHR